MDSRIDESALVVSDARNKELAERFVGGLAVGIVSFVGARILGALSLRVPNIMPIVFEVDSSEQPPINFDQGHRSDGEEEGTEEAPFHPDVVSDGDTGRQGGGGGGGDETSIALGLDGLACDGLVTWAATFLGLEDFAFFEEAFEFFGGGLGAVGGVADVGHVVDAEVAADGAGGGFAGVGGAEHVADGGDDVVSAEGEGDDGGLLHEACDFWVEGFVGDVGVVLGEDGVGELHHFEAADFEACGFEALEDEAGVAFGDGVWLEEDEGGFLGHGGGFSWVC